jgi:hypothetical protein
MYQLRSASKIGSLKAPLIQLRHEYEKYQRKISLPFIIVKNF